MRQKLYLVCLLALATNTSIADNIPTIVIESKTLSDVSGEAVKSADLADALSRNLSSVSLVRRSGIANDIILRGQKKDNINILIDNAKVYGACPNRMDPPTSHVLTNSIDSIEIIEGPYDVKNFGTLSGAVEISTLKPASGFTGEINVNAGRWGYKKLSSSISGGNEDVRYLLSVSDESSDQYKDGDGNEFYQQLETQGVDTPFQYKDIYRDLQAYQKQSILGKLYIDTFKNQELKLSYTANRSDDILYPSSKMDALYDDSNIFNMEYSFTQLGTLSNELVIQFYQSDVDHPMSTFYRNSSGPNAVNEKISRLTTDTQGMKIINHMDLSHNSRLMLGIDTSIRNWDGEYRGKGSQSNITGLYSIPDVDTENTAVFAELSHDRAAIHIKAGLRYDDTTITPQASSGLPHNDYSSLSANVMATFRGDSGRKYFIGAGRAYRVPDARELYFTGAMVNGMMVMKPLIGTPELEDTRNTEIDMGIESRAGAFKYKTRLFHSWLQNYIYYQHKENMMGMPVMASNFQNIDARLYGLEIDGQWLFNDTITFDLGLSYLRGKKDDALPGQTDTDLAEIPPLKANAGINYEYSYGNSASLEVVAADAWDNFDADNGEQAIAGYGVVNMKIIHNISTNFELTVGIDNLFDRSYAVTNTYKDLTLLADGTGDVMLLNEPGRYYYVNGSYRF